MKKAILYIDSMQKGGAQRVMSVLGAYLCGKGIETILVNDIVPQKDKNEYPIDARIRRLFLDQDVSQSGSKNVQRIKKLRKIVKEELPDVVLSFLGPPNYRMLVATAGLHCRKVVSVRNDPYKEYGNGINKVIAGMLFRLADGGVFQTKMAAEYFPMAVRSKSKIILNPIDPSFFEERWVGTENCILTVGRLYPQKNQALLLRAFALVHDRLPGIELKLCGKGSEEENLRNLVKELGIDNCVRFMGEISNVKDELKRNRCFVLSSDYEGLPNALMEAMAVGMPVISTDCPCGGPHMLIRNKENGVLVRCGDMEMLADAIIEVLGNKEKQLELGQCAKESATCFRIEIVMNEWLDYLFVESDSNEKDER